MSIQENSVDLKIHDFLHKIKNKRLELQKVFPNNDNVEKLKKSAFLIQENVIGLKISFNPIILSDVQTLFQQFYKSNYPYFDEKNQIYTIELHFSNFKLLNQIIKKYDFEVEESCQKLIEKFEKNQNNETIITVNNDKIEIQTFDIFVSKYVDQFLKTLRG